LRGSAAARKVIWGLRHPLGSRRRARIAASRRSFGYLFDNDDGSGTLYTSALDFTASGDPTDELMVVDTCYGKAKKPVLQRQIIRPLREGHRKK
jgi:hypothetical protein